MASAARGIALLLLAVSVALIIAATTMPWSMYYVGHSHWANVEWLPFSRRVRPNDFLLNILLFVPFGFSAQLCGTASRERVHDRLVGLVVAAAFLLSVAAEVFQVYCHGRLPTTTDIISNALGAYLGTFIGRDRSSRTTTR